MRIIQNLFFIVVLIQLSQVLAAPRSIRPSTPGSQPPSQSNSPTRSTRSQSESRYSPSPRLTENDPEITFRFENGTRLPIAELLNIVLNTTPPDDEPNGFTKWNNFVIAYVHENIPEIKQNKAIRDYLLRIKYWAPKSLKIQLGNAGELAETVRRLAFTSTGQEPIPMTNAQYKTISYDLIHAVIDDMYKAMENECRTKGLVIETATLLEFRVNKFLVFKTIGERDHQLFVVEHLPRTPENLWQSTLDGIAYVKKHFEPLPCPFRYEVESQ